MLALSPSLGYIHEPFNLEHRPGICSAKFDHWFTYICSDNEIEYMQPIRDCLNFNYNISKQITATKNAKEFAKFVRDVIIFAIFRISKRRPLLKDPIAIFSAGWLSRNFDIDVIVLTRYPAAFVGSIVKANWEFPFAHLLNQPYLMRDYFEDFRSTIGDFAKTQRDKVDQAILLWNLIHHVISKYQISFPEWIFVKHERLSLEPINEFRKLYDRIGLVSSETIEKRIMKYSLGNSSLKDSQNGLKRDSKSNISTWKNRLTNEQIHRVKIGTDAIARAFYDDSDWY